jgi:hypothetical protein
LRRHAAYSVSLVYLFRFPWCVLLRAAARCCTLLRAAARCCALLRAAARCCALLRAAARCCALLRAAARRPIPPRPPFLGGEYQKKSPVALALALGHVFGGVGEVDVGEVAACWERPVNGS